MKINSNTLNLTKENDAFKALETVISKVASENNIQDVESVEIILSEGTGLVGFKIAQTVPPVQQQQQQPITPQPAQQTPVPEQITPEEQSATQATQEIGQEQPVTPEEQTEQQGVETPTKETKEPLSPEQTQEKLTDMQKQYEETLANQAQQGDPAWFKEFDDLITQSIQQKQQEGQPV